jgi:queuine tRNA-ribosyltransferase
MTGRLDLRIQAQDAWSQARATSFRTLHGEIETPIFMPVATQAALRGVDLAIAENFDYRVLLANTYHLLLRPGPELFRKWGGIHPFMKWPHAVLTDSGGFQIFSLSKQLKLSEEGARFRSYVDGDEILLTPERSIETQRAIGSDIMMVLDQCIDSTSDLGASRAALQLTTRWAKRSLAARGDSPQSLFGIIQGACFKELRRESAAQITEMPFDGFAIGGLAVGETRAEREDMTEYTAPLLPADRPRYLMGVGTPIDLLEAVKRGVDMFDCILPTSLAHQGVCFTTRGKIDLRRGVYRNNEDSLDPACSCSTCTRFSKAYLHHLVRAGEFVADQLLSIHNLFFYRELMRGMRQSILQGSFREFYTRQKPFLEARDVENPSVPPKRKKERDEHALGDYQVVQHSTGGFGSVKQVSSGETMHSVSDPVVEAEALYVDQSRLRERVLASGGPLVVWDVGLGAATNAMVCLKALEDMRSDAPRRPVQIISFERDLDSLRLALRHPRLFRHLRHPAPHALLESGVWRSKEERGVGEGASIEWRLLKGDFSKLFESAPLPEVILYDPFSAKVDTELWEYSIFERLLRYCEQRGDFGTSLYTYTNSTSVRAALLAAGWFVGRGRATGPKSETTTAGTLATCSSPFALNLLGKEWLERWERSDARQPAGTRGEEFLLRIPGHPQFGGSAGIHAETIQGAGVP